MLQLYQCSRVSFLIGPMAASVMLSCEELGSTTKYMYQALQHAAPGRVLALGQLTLFQTKPQTMSELWHGQGSTLGRQFGKAPMFWWVSRSNCVDAVRKVSFH